MIKNTFLWPIFQWLQLRRLQLPRVYSTFEGSSFSSIDREKVTRVSRGLLENFSPIGWRTWFEPSLIGQEDLTQPFRPTLRPISDPAPSTDQGKCQATSQPNSERTNIRFRFHNPNFLILDFTWFETTQAWHTTPRQLAHPQLDPNVNIQITRPLGLEPVVGGQLSGG